MYEDYITTEMELLFLYLECLDFIYFNMSQAQVSSLSVSVVVYHDISEEPEIKNCDVMCDENKKKSS